MNILICAKHVPDTEEVKLSMNQDGKTLARDGIASVMNDFDSYALEAAARLKDTDPQMRIIIMTLGPAQARTVVKDGLAVSADAGYHVTDPAFLGSDAMATGYAISRAVKAIEEREGEVSAVFCGKQTVDGETAQVGAVIAENLGWPQVTGCVEAVVESDKLNVHREVKGGVESILVSFPCVITFAKPAWAVRYPTIKRKLAANRTVIPQLTAADLPGLDLTKIGLDNASVTMLGISYPPKKQSGLIINEETPEESAQKLFEAMTAANLI